MTRTHGRARKGARVGDRVPNGHWRTTTLVAAITSEGAIAPMVLDGPMDTPAFQAYVEQVLIPELPEDAIVVMDNLCAHKAHAIQTSLQEAGAQCRYLPAYSPDLNPIEMIWSKVKTSLRQAKARTEQQLNDAIAQALKKISSSDTKGCFRHCGAAIKN